MGRNQIRPREGRAQGQNDVIVETIDLIKNKDLWNVAGPNPRQHPAYRVDLANRVWISCIDDVDEHIGRRRLLQSGRKSLDEVMG